MLKLIFVFIFICHSRQSIPTEKNQTCFNSGKTISKLYILVQDVHIFLKKENIILFIIFYFLIFF